MQDLLRNGIDLSTIQNSKVKHSMSLRLDKFNSEQVREVARNHLKSNPLSNLELDNDVDDIFATNQNELEQMMDDMLLGDGQII